jgi:hypothetical protein
MLQHPTPMERLVGRWFVVNSWSPYTPIAMATAIGTFALPTKSETTSNQRLVRSEGLQWHRRTYLVHIGQVTHPDSILWHGFYGIGIDAQSPTGRSFVYPLSGFRILCILSVPLYVCLVANIHTSWSWTRPRPAILSLMRTGFPFPTFHEQGSI